MDDEQVKISADSPFQCSICYDDFHQNEQIWTFNTCQCRFCRECVRQYSINQLNSISVPIRCPNGECNSLVSLNQLENLFDEKQFNLYKKLLVDHEVTNDPHRVFCPHVDCGQILVLPAERQNHEEFPMICSKCRTKFCLKCRSSWHPNVQCSDLLTPYEMEADCNIKRCPRCRFPLEWVAGCAQIMCVNCKHIFCWYCLKSLDNDFFLLHFERGPCRNRLGHSRASLFLHRLTIVGIFLGLILLLFIAIPFLILSAPCLLCCRYKQIKNHLKNFTKLGQRFQQQQYTPTAHPSPSASLHRLNSSSLIEIENETNLLPTTPLMSENVEKNNAEISPV